MSSSDSEEENVELLREALDVKFVSKDLYNGEHNSDRTAKPELTEKPPSLRRNISKEDEALNIYRVTPEFREHVSKQLFKIIEKKLSKLIDENDASVLNNPIKARKKNSRVKLLKASKNYITDFEETGDDKSCVVKKFKPRVYKSRLDNDNLSEEERCKLAAVNPVDVINKTETKCWSKRSKAKVYEYKKDSNGNLIFQPFKFN